MCVCVCVCVAVTVCKGIRAAVRAAGVSSRVWTLLQPRRDLPASDSADCLQRLSNTRSSSILPHAGIQKRLVSRSIGGPEL